MVSFTWFPGLSVAQKQRSIDSLHAAAGSQVAGGRILEISSKSRDSLGVALSAFNLTFAPAPGEPPMSVECAFQGSKVFTGGGPFTDLYRKTSREAKRDERLHKSGNLVAFRFRGEDWPLQPPTAFYDWLYLNALSQHPGLAAEVLEYSAFTDIEFNPERSLNCQARSVALFVALSRQGCLAEALSSREAFLDLLQTGA